MVLAAQRPSGATFTMSPPSTWPGCFNASPTETWTPLMVNICDATEDAIGVPPKVRPRGGNVRNRMLKQDNHKKPHALPVMRTTCCRSRRVPGGCVRSVKSSNQHRRHPLAKEERVVEEAVVAVEVVVVEVQHVRVVVKVAVRVERQVNG